MLSDSVNVATVLRRRRLPPSLMALTQSHQAVTLFLLDFSGHILKLATLIADIMPVSSWFLPQPDTLDVSLTSSVKNLVTKLREKFGRETLSAKHSGKNMLLTLQLLDRLFCPLLSSSASY